MNTETKLPEGVPPLTTFYMYITGGCNLACRHCWIAPTFEQTGTTGDCLDYDLYKLAIKQAMPLGLTSIKFTGGEPLLHPEFVQMVDYATQKGLQSRLETNGTLISYDLARYLKESTSLSFVSVSLDGSTAATHEYIRNVKGCFEETRQGIYNLVKAGYRPQIIMSLFPDNLDEIELLIHWATETGCSSIKFNLIQPSGRGAQMKKNEKLSIEELVRLGNWIEKDLQKDISLPLLFCWPMAFHGIKRLLSGQGEPCDIFHILGILSSGKLAMCGIGTQEKDLIYGKLGVDNVVDIWASHTGLQELREIIPEHLEGICGQCIFKNRCLASCVAHNYYSEKSLTAPFWFCTQADKSGIFPLPRRY